MTKLPIPPLHKVIAKWKKDARPWRLGQYFINMYHVIDDDDKLWEANEHNAKIILMEMYTRYQWGD